MIIKVEGIGVKSNKFYKIVYVNIHTDVYRFVYILKQVVFYTNTLFDVSY